ncbi:MAG: undecaprenyl phosphate translocase family protein [Mycoplasmoidaceae bacterium]
MENNNKIGNDIKNLVKNNSIHKKDPYDFKKGILTRIIFGILMAISDAIPGYSGGTTLTFIGFYDKLIFRFKKIFSKVNYLWINNILWLLPFLIAWGLGMYGFSSLIEIIIKAKYTYLLILIFSLFTFLSIPTFIIVNKPHLIDVKTKKLLFKKNYNIKSLIFFLIGISIVIAVGVYICLSGGIVIDGRFDHKELDNYKSWPLIIFSLMLAGFAILIPGFSGSMILFLTHNYDKVYFGLFQHFWLHIPLIILSLISMIIGIILNVLLASFLLKKYHNYYLSFSFGLVSGSFITIIVSGANNFKAFDHTHVSLNIALIFLSLLIIIVLNIGLFFISWNRFKNEYEKKLNSNLFL